MRRWTSLPHAHRPEMADWLNDPALSYAVRTPEALVCGTFLPEPGAASYVGERLADVQV